MREDKNETRWDKLLHIRTMGRDDSHSDEHRFPYEPTPYCVLERLANSGCIRKGNTVIDYGCGKGRVDFFLAYQTRCNSIGVEYDERIFGRAMENKADSVVSDRVDFVQANAETFKVPETNLCNQFHLQTSTHPLSSYKKCIHLSDNKKTVASHADLHNKNQECDPLRASEVPTKMD